MTTTNDFTKTQGTIGTGFGCNNLNFCGYRLPCGLCRLLMSKCPEFYSQPNITWCASDSTVTNPCEGAAKAVMRNE